MQIFTLKPHDEVLQCSFGVFVGTRLSPIPWEARKETSFSTPRATSLCTFRTVRNGDIQQLSRVTTDSWIVFFHTNKASDIWVETSKALNRFTVLRNRWLIQMFLLSSRLIEASDNYRLRGGVKQALQTLHFATTLNMGCRTCGAQTWILIICVLTSLEEVWPHTCPCTQLTRHCTGDQLKSPLNISLTFYTWLTLAEKLAVEHAIQLLSLKACADTRKIDILVAMVLNHLGESGRLSLGSSNQCHMRWKMLHIPVLWRPSTPWEGLSITRCCTETLWLESVYNMHKTSQKTLQRALPRVPYPYCLLLSSGGPGFYPE